MSTYLEIIQDAQQVFYDAVVGNLTALHEGQAGPVFWALMGASFLYGFFHAIGPGHGKVIVATYLLADDGTLKRGLWITALSSLMQGAVAVTLVLGLYYLLGIARDKTELTASWFEAGSFALIALVGAHMIWRGFLAYRHKDCVHDHCGHDHHQASNKIQSTMAMIVSIGIRPCSGGLLVMFFACLFEVIAIGIMATFVMAIGTGLATSLIAVAAAGSRQGLLKLVAEDDARLRALSVGIKILGGLLLVVLGGSFALVALSMAGHGFSH